MSAQPKTSERCLHERLLDEVRWACPADGFHATDADALLASDDYLFGHALVEYFSEVYEALSEANFASRIARLYIEAGSTCPGSPDRAAAQSLLTHTLRNQFEAIVREKLAPLIKTDLNEIAESRRLAP